MDLPSSDRARAVPGDVPLPRRVLASWQRSQEYGVPLDAVDPVFTGSAPAASVFLECGTDVLRELHQNLAGEPVSLMLTDAEGVVLNRLSGDHGLLRALDVVHLAPGFSYAEREAGTNGVGLALADRMPTLVRAEEHYASSLCTYTCAAAPVLDPLTGRLEGAVNITTWGGDSSSDLLLALARSAAGTTSALMLARSAGQHPRPSPRGEVRRVEAVRLEPGAGTLHHLGPGWSQMVDEAAARLAEGRVVAAVGESGAGRSTAVAQALRRVRPHDRILSVRAPAPEDAETWLRLWSPELGKPHTAVVVCDVDDLPLFAQEQLRDLVAQRPEGSAVALTARDLTALPTTLRAVVESVVTVPPLRERPADVVPLARHLAAGARGREVDLTRSAEQALASCGWPGNVEQLRRVVRDAATRSDTVDVRHLPAEVLSGSQRRLSRIETFERDEIVRVLTHPGVTMQQAAEELGMSRATLYRKLTAYDIHVPRG